MQVYLNSYYPLGCTEKGRMASYLFSLPFYIDGSFRREPDFEHSRPCVTGLFRPQLVRKLEKGDLIVYMTKDPEKAERKIVAVLRVIAKMANHRMAASWYKEKELAIPNNLIISQSKPVSPDETHGLNKYFGCNQKNQLRIERDYANRAGANPVVAICRIWKKQLNLQDPPPLSNSDVRKIFRRGSLRDFEILSDAEWELFQRIFNKGNSIRSKRSKWDDENRLTRQSCFFLIPDT